ncbi:DUF647-domain-containing protein [Xylariomycetidae sp. FL0641]|nr:DUF647-domain-containing protein [Xylariomycetidae sp. FL0641]
MSSSSSSSSSPRLVSAADESGILCAYDADGNAKTRPRSYARDVLDVFLPAGYPRTVTPDYTPYQIYDSLQAFSSTIAGLLAARAVLQGFGVGDAASSATGAVLLTVFQESTGRLATILFAHRAGRAIEAEAKYFRYLADLLNDGAMVLDLLSPSLPPGPPRVLALVASGVLRACCGVAGDSAKASLSAHFAAASASSSGNLAELNAKDGSQETVISLLGLLVGSLFVRAVEGRAAAAAAMLFLLAAHLATNYAAVRAVQLRTLSRQRAALVAAEFVRSGRVLRPRQAAEAETILRWRPARDVRFAQDVPRKGEIPPEVLRGFADAMYVVVEGRGGGLRIYLKDGATTRDALEAWLYALVGPRSVIDETFWKALEAAGWDLQKNALETGPAVRIKVE